MSELGGAVSTDQLATLASGSFTSRKIQACGLIQSIRVTVPRNVTGLLASNSAANEWWAAVDTEASMTATAPNRIVRIGFPRLTRETPRSQPDSRSPFQY